MPTQPRLVPRRTQHVAPGPGGRGGGGGGGRARGCPHVPGAPELTGLRGTEQLTRLFICLVVLFASLSCSITLD